MPAFIGMMSGTSLDGVDAVVMDGELPMRVLAHGHRAFEVDLRQELLALNQAGPDELHRAALAGNALTLVYAGLALEVMGRARCTPAGVRAIGAHGQTLRHRPGAFDGIGYTLQLFNGALLAERCGVDVVCDFRSRDLAAGGQGAPLVPAFHAAAFGREGRDLAVLNLGGIGNWTLLPATAPLRGFDCGPGNLLLDAWCARHTGHAFDSEGRWAAQGTVQDELLRRMLEDDFLALEPPKSTGRDHYNPAWLERLVDASGQSPAPVDVQATLLEFTARAAVDALHRFAPGTEEVIVCGGGAFNLALMRRLASLVAPAALRTSDELGLPVDQVEAAAFAWLARAHVERRAGGVAAVTGACGDRVLGALYPA